MGSVISSYFYGVASNVSFKDNDDILNYYSNVIYKQYPCMEV